MEWCRPSVSQLSELTSRVVCSVDPLGGKHRLDGYREQLRPVERAPFVRLRRMGVQWFECRPRRSARQGVVFRFGPRGPTGDHPSRISQRASNGHLPETIRIRLPRQSAPLPRSDATGRPAARCRRGELCGLRWSDCEGDKAPITVRRSISDTRRGVEVKDPLTNRARRISLDAATISVLTTHHERVEQRARDFGSERSSKACICSQLGDSKTPRKPDRVDGAFRIHRKRANLEHVDHHHLRHSCATAPAGAGVDVQTFAGSEPDGSLVQPPGRRSAWAQLGENPPKPGPGNRRGTAKSNVSLAARDSESHA